MAGGGSLDPTPRIWHELADAEINALYRSTEIGRDVLANPKNQ